MQRRPKRTHVEYEVGTKNVYVDLRLPNADEMLIKAQLVASIGSIIAEKGFTQTKAAEVLGLTQPKLSRLLRGQFRGFSERKLMDCLTRLGRDVQIVIRPVQRRRAQGSLSVITM